jgi:hypothetical protein
MSIHSGLASHIEEEGEVLRRLNEATLHFQAGILGDTELLGLTHKQVKKSGKVLSEFLQNLLEAIDKPTGDATIAFLVNCLRDGPKPMEDWKEDIQRLINAIKTGKSNDACLSSIEDILALLNDDYSEGVRALYYR